MQFSPFNTRPDGLKEPPDGSSTTVINEINRIAIALAAMPSSDDLPRFLTRHLKDYTNAAFVVFTEYRSADRVLVPLYAEADSLLLKKSLALIGKSLSEIRSPVDDAVYQEIVSSPLGVRHSLHEMTFGAIPESISFVLKAITGTDRYYGVAYVIEGELFGTSVIALKKGQADPSPEFLSMFAYLAAVSLRRMHADDARRRSDEKFSAVFHRCPIGINIARMDNGQMVEANDAILEMFEYTRREAIGTSARNLNIWLDDAERETFYNQVKQGKVRNFETRLRTKSGRIVDVSLNSVVIIVAGEQYYMNFVEDISERKRSEEVRARLEQQLYKAQRMESIGTLAGGIAHDFNNLLAMLLGNAELLKTHLGSDPALTKYIDRIIDVSSRGSSITKQLLLFSRHSDLALQPVLLSELVDEVRTMLVHFIPKTITVKSVRSSEASHINADAGLIHQVLLNLCLNAKDAMTDSGTLTLTEYSIDAGAIKQRFDTETSGSFVALAVHDTGAGIDADHLTKIFDPFFTTKDKGKGTGLGLSIVHGIMKSHSGYIDVESSRTTGTTFTLFFPTIEPPAHAAE